MTGGLEHLFLAMVAFIGSHFLLSAHPVRSALIGQFGENPFRGTYSLVALTTFLWVIFAFRAAPVTEVWTPPSILHGLSFVLMLLASILAASGLSTRNPTAVGGEKLIADLPRPVGGIVTITRHPFQWAVVLWGVSHLATNGDAASIILFGGLMLLSLIGMVHIDARRAQSLGADWGPFAMRTSLVPFYAMLQGRVKADWAGIGWIRLFAGIALFLILLLVHGWIAGIPLLPLPLSA